MELNKENVKKIIGIMSFGVILYFILQNFVGVRDAFFNLVNVLSPFLFGAGLAFVLNIPLRMFERKLFKPKKLKNGKEKHSKFKRPVSIFLSFVLIILIICFVIKLVIPQLLSVIFMFIKDVPNLAYNAKEYAIELTDQYPDISDQIENIEVDWDKVTNDIINFVTNFAKNVLTSSVGVIVSFIGGVFDTIVAIVFSIYILLNKETLTIQAKKLIRAYLPKDKAEYVLKICSISKNTFHNFITGQCTEAVILGTLCFLGMLILRIPFATTVGVLVGVTALIPIVGAFIGAIVGVILIVSVAPVKALIFIIFLVVLQQIESNVIYPKVVGNSVGLPGMWVLLAVVVGGSLWGALGLLIGLPIASVLYTILRDDVNKRLKEKSDQLNM